MFVFEAVKFGSIYHTAINNYYKVNDMLREGVNGLECLALEMLGRGEAKNTKKGDWKGSQRSRCKRP